jgi:hypothetical protein
MWPSHSAPSRPGAFCRSETPVLGSNTTQRRDVLMTADNSLSERHHCPALEGDAALLPF